MAFDLEKECLRLKKQTRLMKRNRYSTSKIDKYKHEVLALHGAGGNTLKEIKLWLKEKRIIVKSESTIQRWLIKNENA